ncbi:hypothetical protein T02_13750 [Trichinella nativa]|uniref:Uncharacterized protein n=1 Tax=Trichinella nativa TaxID=6335 RepID=A0A0V1L5F6_9BILA|nr:hypothetical protein T02_13750 [Trichinella nativa]
MAAMPFPALPALLDSTQANFVAASRWVLPWTPRTCEFQYFPRELRERELWQLPDSSRGGSLSGVAAVAARRSIVLLLPQPGVGSRPCFQKEPPALCPALIAASFLDSAFAAVVISHDCYAYSLIGCRGIRIGGPKCTNRLGVLYACDAQVRRHQARLTAAGEELTVALGSSWQTEYGQSRKRSKERAQSTGVNRELIRIQE